MKGKKVIVSPFEHEENDYIKLQIECIRAAGYEPVPQTGHKKDANYVLYNWYENMGGIGGVLLIKKLLMLNYYRITGKKIIWVMHNKQPHEAGDKYSLFMMKYLSKISHAIMILSDTTLESLKKINNSLRVVEKVHKVPLISYETLVGTIPEKEDADELNLLLFGRIQPYKCIEQLIEAVNTCKHKEHIHVYITGSSQNSVYIEKLRNLIGNNENVVLKPKFISLDELKILASDADAFVLPMNIESSLNSSAVMMAFSLGRTVICPEIGTIKEIDASENFVYSYNYSNDKEHIEALRKAIDCAYEERSTLKKKGRLALNHIRIHNSIESVSKKFNAMFNNCL